jgi:hypothetical protein
MTETEVVNACSEINCAYDAFFLRRGMVPPEVDTMEIHEPYAGAMSAWEDIVPVVNK